MTDRHTDISGWVSSLPACDLASQQASRDQCPWSGSLLRTAGGEAESKTIGLSLPRGESAASDPRLSRHTARRVPEREKPQEERCGFFSTGNQLGAPGRGDMVGHVASDGEADAGWLQCHLWYMVALTGREGRYFLHRGPIGGDLPLRHEDEQAGLGYIQAMGRSVTADPSQRA